MKYLYLLLLTFLLYSTSRAQQTQILGNPTSMIEVKGAIKADSVLQAPRVKAIFPWQDSLGRIWYNPADGSLNYHDATSWIKLLSGSSSGTVTNIATTAPITGGPITTTGTIGITQSTTSTSGYLSSTDWNTFNNKGNGTVTSVGLANGGGLTISGATSPITTAGTYSVSMPPTGTAGTYGTASSFPVITTDAFGRVSGVTTQTVTTTSGTVTSVGLAGGAGGITINNSPITTSGTMSVVLPAIGSAGTYGTTTSFPIITTDAFGRVSAVSTQTVTTTSGTVTSITAGAGLSGGTITTSGTISMPNVGTASTYGTASSFPIITTDAQGRVSGVTTQTVTTTNGTVTSVGLNSTSTITITGSTSPITTSGTYSVSIPSSVALAGNPTTTTQTAGDNSNKIATTAYIETYFKDSSLTTVTTGTLTPTTTVSGQLYRVTYNITALANSVNIANTTSAWADGQTLILNIRGTAARAITYGTNYDLGATSVAPATTITTTKLSLEFVYESDGGKFFFKGFQNSNN